MSKKQNWIFGLSIILLAQTVVAGGRMDFLKKAAGLAESMIGKNAVNTEKEWFTNENYSQVRNLGDFHLEQIRDLSRIKSLNDFRLVQSLATARNNLIQEGVTQGKQVERSISGEQGKAIITDYQNKLGSFTEVKAVNRPGQDSQTTYAINYITRGTSNHRTVRVMQKYREDHPTRLLTMKDSDLGSTEIEFMVPNEFGPIIDMELKLSTFGKSANTDEELVLLGNNGRILKYKLSDIKKNGGSVKGVLYTVDANSASLKPNVDEIPFDSAPIGGGMNQ